MRKQMKRMIAIGLTSIICLAMAGCGKPYTGNSDADPSNYELAKGATRTNYVTAQMMAKADMWLEQDDSAIAEVMRRAEAGESITIATIGGSITEGTISAGASDSKKIKSKKSYANIFAEWWTAMFPQAEIRLVNAGIGGTDSYLGVHRLEADVLSEQPDLVLVEYAVNDGANDFYKTSYENLVRNLLTAENKPAVLLYFFGQTNGNTSQANQSQIGLNYHVPMLSYMNAIREAMDTGLYTEAELSGDTVHPSALGHAIAGEILWHYLNEVYSNKDRYKDFAYELPEPVTKAKYEAACIMDSDSITPDSLGSFQEANNSPYFPNGWKAAGNDGIVFTASFRCLGILYLKTVDGKSGKFDVFVDGTKVKTINADFSGGWGNAIEGAEAYTSDAVAEHVIEIRRAEDSTASEFRLLGLMISQ